MKQTLLVSCAVMAIGAGAIAQPVVFRNSKDNGYFAPFTSASAASIRYGDSGWLNPGGAAPLGMYDIRLGLAAAGNAPQGFTDLIFTFNDGDPSGLVFGPGTTLYSTTLHNVTIPSSGDGPVFFDITIPLPGVVTSGDYNNIGWSVGVSNFNYAGTFGFQCASTLTQSAGYYTNNASFYNGSSWSLFSFGPDPTFGVANFVATVRSVPTPGALAILGVAGFIRRRR